MALRAAAAVSRAPRATSRARPRGAGVHALSTPRARGVLRHLRVAAEPFSRRAAAEFLDIVGAGGAKPAVACTPDAALVHPDGSPCVCRGQCRQQRGFRFRTASSPLRRDGSQSPRQGAAHPTANCTEKRRAVKSAPSRPPRAGAKTQRRARVDARATRRPCGPPAGRTEPGRRTPESREEQTLATRATSPRVPRPEPQRSSRGPGPRERWR